MPTEDLFNKTHFGQTGQVLAPDNVSPNIDEAMEARVKDPLWFLARQWQSGEFEAENGGRVAHVDLQWSQQSISQLDTGNGFTAIDPRVPLDVHVEAENEAGLSDAWNSAAQEYRFRTAIPNKRGHSRFTTTDYHGGKLDWRHFDIEVLGADAPADQSGTPLEKRKHQQTRIIPTQLAYQGMPHVRWWRFEDARVRLEANDDPEPNALSMLLPEFLLADANNWLVFPVEQPVGHLRKVTSLRLIDSFGVATDIDAGCQAKQSWQIFTHDREDSEDCLGGEYLLVPNVAPEVAQGEIIEEIALLRDEDANCVWAVEHWYWDQDKSRRIYRGDRGDRDNVQSDDSEIIQEPTYRLKSDIAAHWIPYVPRLINPKKPDGEIYLRRARSVEWASRDNPQYKGQLISEAWRLNEEEVPLRGLKVQRLYRFTRDLDGQAHIWIARRKDVGPMDNWPGLEFDYIEDSSS